MKAIKAGLVLLLMLVTAGVAIAMTTTATATTTANTFRQIQLTDPRSLQIEQTGLVEEYYLYEGGKW